VDSFHRKPPCGRKTFLRQNVKFSGRFAYIDGNAYYVIINAISRIMLQNRKIIVRLGVASVLLHVVLQHGRKTVRYYKQRPVPT